MTRCLLLSLACLLPLQLQAANYDHNALTSAERVLKSCYDEVEVRAEVANCLNEALGVANARMKTVFQAVLDEALDLDKFTGQERVAPALQSSQDAFIAFREQECQRKLELAFPGTGAGDIYRACMISLTNWRSDTLVVQKH